MRHRLFIPAATALLFALAACTQDELADDNRLPEGEYPVVIRATGLSVEATPLAAPSTRAAVDGDWQGVTSVALKMGDAVKEYTVTASTDFKSATLSRENLDMDVFHAIKEKYLDDFKAAMDTDDKNVRDAALLPIMDKIAEEIGRAHV